MFNIYETLKSGHMTADEIAREFVNELNAANARIEADQAAAERAAKAEAQKAKDTQTVVDCVNAYLATYYPTVKPIDAKFIEETIHINEAANVVVDSLQQDNVNIDKVFADFLKQLGV